MTAGKSRKVFKNKGRKQIVDTYAKKKWYKIVAPAPYQQKKVSSSFCFSPVNKSQGKVLSDNTIKGRIFEVSAGDLLNNENHGFQIIKLEVSHVDKGVCYTTFKGMRFTTDKLASLVCKWHTLIRSVAEVTTTDGFTLRVFTVAVTRRRRLQLRKTTYAQKSQTLKISLRMKDIIRKTVSGGNIKDFCSNLTDNVIGTEIAKACAGVYPLQSSYIYKVKVLKTPKTDGNQIMESFYDMGESL
eukprot:NODE_3386_length_780_cov_65.532148_g2829_i0.p1 GENE.NODE_3386_length_780_cov_65.532148_g2829_i0~~NODE_3386_length_780_cov_65.532148_g2829_i0.p1  ORF type:complete len:257 (+),score=3.42 NODE_3386_length_780_cov_65.532148_g2829_i0:48-773(+)